MRSARAHVCVVGVGLLGAAALWAATTNIAPDAVTHATHGYNVFEGDLASLTDGLYPGNAADSGAFTVETKGNLVFAFGQSRAIDRVRLYVGDNAGRYAAVAYRGARYDTDSGQTDASAAEFVADALDESMAQNAWVELAFPTDTRADYVEVNTQSGATFYEIQILADGGSTPVQPVSWAAVKSGEGR